VPRPEWTETRDAGLAIQSTTDPARNAERMVRALSVETLGRGRVERGLVHPYYVQLGKTLVKQWDADRVVAQGSLSTWAEQMGKNARIYNELWLDTAAQYGKSGAPVLGDGRGDGRKPTPLDGVGGLPGVDLQARREVQRQLRKQFEATRRATIRVVQDQTGKLTDVELVDPSTDAAVDRQALEDVRAAAERLPPPPPEALGARNRLSSLWSFELVISISPPVPTFTFEFDEVVGTVDPRLPLDRRVYKKVRLVSVE
jgi:TonB family protein